MSAQTLLIIGAGHEQVPAIRKARMMGLRVAVTDANPDAPGMSLADVSRVVSTNDRSGNLAIARELSVAGVMTLGSERAVPVVAHVASSLGLPGYSEATALAATNKNVMRERFAAFGVPTTESQSLTTADVAFSFVDRYGFPVVLKPSDNSGQRGTALVQDPVALETAVSDALRFASDGKAIIEKFHAGPEINVTAAVEKGKIHFLSLSERVTAPPPHFGIAVEHVSPPPLNDEQREAIMEASRRAIHAVGLTDGIAYPQVLHTTDGPRVLEIAVRIPGGHMYEVALHASGIDMIEFSILMAMGHPSPLAACTRHPVSPALSVRFLTELDFPDKDLPVRQIEPLDAALRSPGVQMVRMHLTAGERLPTLAHSGARFGAVLALGATREEACKRTREAARLIEMSFGVQPEQAPIR